jgi:DNA-binding GntR family transcriptional regulator
MAHSDLLDRLRDAILSLALEPGRSLSERGLEPEFGASRTPIRAALMRLESEGLVRRDGKGWIVSPLDLGEIRSLYEYRGILESASARLAANRATRDDLEKLALLAGLDDADETPEHSMELGTSFHLELARLSGNEFLIDSMEGALTRLYRTRWLEVQTPDARDRARREHLAITTALLGGDGAAAELATVRHLQGTGERLVASLGESSQRLRATGVTIGA